MRQCIVTLMVVAYLLPGNLFGQAEEPVTNDAHCYTLTEAIDIALANNPELATHKLELQAAEARLKQAGLWENPTFTAEAENFSGDNPGFSRSENTFSLSQPFLLGGKRDYRKEIALQEREILRLHYDAKKRDVILGVEVAVYEILMARRMVEFAQQAVEIAREVYQAKESKMENGESRFSEESLSIEIELSETEMDLLNAKKDLKIATKKLALLLGDSEIHPGECTESLERKYKIPEYGKLKQCLLENNPALLAHMIREEQGSSLLNYAKAERVPDVEFSFGVRQFNEDDSYAFVGGLSLPLPLFNRNQGGIEEALLNQKKIEVDRHAEKNTLFLELDEHYRTYQIMEQEIDVLRKRILPKAEEMLKKTMEGYEKHHVDYLGVLEARRTLIEARKKYIRTLGSLNLSIAHLERLCATHFHGADGEMF